MKFFSRLFSTTQPNFNTAMERKRLAQTMPGQTAAVAGARLGVLVN